MGDQITNTILMIRPANFGYNQETAANNAFQTQDNSLSMSDISQKAKEEFDEFVRRLRAAGINILVHEDTSTPVKPDAVFPNNWVTFHDDGTVATYPMNAPTRRLERREDVLELLISQFNFQKRIQFEQNESIGRFLEGTGSLILDRPNRIAYACLSPRTDEALLDEFCEKLGYKKAAFTAVDGDGQEIYHTNVMMALGTSFVVICMDTIRNAEERSRLLQQFAETGKEVIEISLGQMMAFAGNMLQVKNNEGTGYLIMSEQAYQSLTAEQIVKIKEHTEILHSPLYTIEKYGGGSARCMMAEVFVGN
ncbi:MAG: arginine deiminase-related protein [Chitinophagales bacterium]|nr:arginine deiminase-related protein [Chitinophagales bacterium]